MDKYVDSYISGDFEGWDGDAVYALDDGSRWELVNYSYLYAYQFRPRTIVWRDGDRFFMEVQGMQDRQEVQEVC